MRTIVILALAASCLAAGAASAQAMKSPEVVRTGKGPTGYTVTFRLSNPAAQRVQIRGEWSFERPGDLIQIAGSPNRKVVETPGILPAAWKIGDVPIVSPNSTAANWPIAEMKKDARGVWSLTTPLPPGIFSYTFLVDCPDPTPGQPAPATCKRISDPSNRPWNEAGGAVVGSTVNSSQVYVPADAVLGGVDFNWQAPAPVKGKLTHETYASPGHANPADKNYLVVYTPPGYDAERAKPYPTLWLSHGGGGSEMDWSTQGAAGPILDNLINSGEIQPLVVVMPNAGGFAGGNFNEAYDRDLIDRMLPLVEAKYHVSKSPKDRAFSGLSAGGILTNSFMIKYPATFQYYGMMSAGLPPAFAKLTAEQTAALKGKSLWVGGGWQDVIHEAGFSINGAVNHTGPARQVSTMAAAGLPVTTAFVHGGHQWYVWRILLKDFLTRTAFLPAPDASGW